MLWCTLIDTEAGWPMDSGSAGVELWVSKNEKRLMFVTIRAVEQK
jgi:hypothetical protein